MFMRVRFRDVGERRGRVSVARRLARPKNAVRPFWKSEASGKGKKYLHDGAGPLRPSPRATRGREALRGESLASGIYRADVAGWAKGGGRTFRGGGERSPAFPARRAACDWRQPASARSGAHSATPRLRALQRPRGRGRPRRGRCRASERVSKRHRHEIAPENRAGRALIALPGGGAVLELSAEISAEVFAVRSENALRICRSADSGEFFVTKRPLEIRIWAIGALTSLSKVCLLRGAPSHAVRTPRVTCRPALHGGRTRGARRADTDRTRAFGRRLEAPPRAARSALGSRIFIFSSGTRGLEEQGGSTSAGFRASGGDDRGKPRPGTMPTDRVDDPQIVPWIEKDDLAYYGPFRCVSAPARPARRTTRVQIDADPTTAVFAREGWRWRKIRFDAL